MQGTDEITNSEDIIDSRDVIARIEYLEDELRLLVDESKETGNSDILAEWLGCNAGAEGLDSFDMDKADDLQEFGESDQAKELFALRALAEEAEGYCADWRHGEALIRDSYFEDYAREFAADIGAIDRDAKWPNDCIDWEKAADELKADYTSVNFDNVIYWTR